MNDERNFDRLLDIQEKSIIAWERTTDKLEELTKENREIKILLKMNSRADEKFTRWIKIITAAFAFIATLVALFFTLNGN